VRWADARLAVALLFAALVASACGGGSGDTDAPTAAPSVIASPTAPGVSTLGDPGLTVRNVVQACREKDAELIQSYVVGDVPLSEVLTLFARGSDVQLLSQTVPDAPADTTTITVRLRIRRESGSEEVERDWELVRGDDGLWRLTALPDCF
jgi:hypothetical protein